MQGCVQDTYSKIRHGKVRSKSINCKGGQTAAYLMFNQWMIVSMLSRSHQCFIKTMFAALGTPARSLDVA